jgi:hypothetical protein
VIGKSPTEKGRVTGKRPAEKDRATGKCSIKPPVLLLLYCFVWAFSACKQLPEKTDEHPVAELPAQSESGEASSAESARGIHGQIVREDGEETADAGKAPDEEAADTAEIAEDPDKSDEETPEIVLPEPVPSPDPRQIADIPQIAEAPSLAETPPAAETPSLAETPYPAGPDRQDEVLPDPVSPVTRDAPRPRPEIPPPVPEFIRPSEPVSEKSAEAGPSDDLVFALPSRPNPQPEGGPVYSRTVTAYVGQYIEIPFRGPGWVYLGELGSRRGVYYDSRRVDSEGMVFVFRANEEGSYSLKFNRQDFIRDYVINDYVQVSVLPPPEITGSVWHSTAVVPDRVYAAPRWPPADESLPLTGTNPAGAPAPDLSRQAQPDPAATQPAPASQPASTASQQAPATQPASTSQTAQAAPATQSTPQSASAVAQTAPATQPASAATQTAPATQPVTADAGQALPEEALPETAADSVSTAGAAALPAGSPPDAYLARAKEEYDAGRIAGALETLDRLWAAYPGGSDEAYWLYGQALEAAGPSRDIRLALDYYRRLTREYPQSSRYDAARRRIAYLERFYFNIQ